MKHARQIAMVATLIAAVAVVLAVKNSGRKPVEERTGPPASAAVAPAAGKLPRLVDLGAGKCIPCRMMTPILEELKKKYAGRLAVEFIDVWQNPDAGKKYGIEMIPTQIFYDATGKELFRHAGFFAQEDILAKWKELGVDLVR